MDGSECGGCRRRQCVCEMTGKELDELELVAAGDPVWERAFRRLRAEIAQHRLDCARFASERRGGLG